MALNRMKIPIQLRGLDTKTDPNQAVPGSFKQVDNAVYSKLGRLNKRTGYKPLDTKQFATQNSVPSGNRWNIGGNKYTDMSGSLINEKMTRFNNDPLINVKSHTNKNDLHNGRGYVQNADVLNVDINTKSVSNKVYFNPNPNSQDFINEQFQQSTANPSLGLKAFASFDHQTFSMSLKILKDDIEIYNQNIVLGTALSQPCFPTLNFYTANSTTQVLVLSYSLFGTTSALKFLHIPILLNSQTQKWEVASTSTIDVFNTVSGPFDNRSYYDLKKIDANHFALVYNDPTNSLQFKTYVVNGSTITATTSVMNILDAGNPVIANKISINTIAVSSFTSTNYYVVLAYNELDINWIGKTAVKTAIIQFPKAYNAAATYKNVPATLIDFTTRGILNLAVGDYATDDVGFTSHIAIYATTTNTTNTKLANYKINRVEKLIYNVSTNALTSNSVAFYNQTLASKPITINYNDYLITSFNDIVQPTFFVMCVDKRPQVTNNTLIGKFFFQNSGVFLNSKSILASYQVMINEGWVTSLTISKTGTGKGALDIIQKITASFPYRNKYVNLNNIVKEEIPPNASPVYFNAFDYESLSQYRDANESYSIELDLNALNRFANIEINNTKYFVGGTLQYFDKNRLTNVGFHYAPSFKKIGTQGGNPDNDYPNALSTPKTYHKSCTIDTTNDVIKVTGDVREFFPINKKVRLLATSLSPLDLPAGVAHDTTFEADVFQQVTVEMAVRSLNYTGGVTEIAVNLYSNGSPINFTSAGGAGISLYLVKTPYRAFAFNKRYTFFAVYETKDAQGKIYRSTPSPIPYVYVDKGSQPENDTYIPSFVFSTYLVLPVLNYNLVDKNIKNNGTWEDNPVHIRIYRNAKDESVFYECGSAKCDLTSEYINVMTDTNDEDLVNNAVIYTSGEPAVLENIAPPAASAITTKDDRIYMVNAENKSEIWYSKKIVQGEAIEFNDSLIVTINQNPGPILNIQAMDDKIIIFKNSSIYYFAGDGANELGQGSSFTNIEKLGNNIGLDPDNVSSVFLTDQGIFFKSNKGIFLLKRSLQLEYIGAALEDYDLQDGPSMIKVYSVNSAKDKNEVNVCTNQGLFTYNQDQGLWTRSYHNQLLGQPIFSYSDDSGNYMMVVPRLIQQTSNSTLKSINTILMQNQYSSNAVYFIDDLTVDIIGFTDPGFTLAKDTVKVGFVTNFISLAGIQNYARLWRIYLLGSSIDNGVAMKYNFKLLYDYSTPNELDIKDEYNYQRDAAPARSPSDALNCNLHVRRQKCESFAVYFSELDNDLNQPASLTISNLNIEIGAKRKTPFGRYNNTKNG